MKKLISLVLLLPTIALAQQETPNTSAKTFYSKQACDNVISMNGGSFSIVWFWGDNAKTEFPSITYDVFAVNNNVGGVVSEGVPIVPFGGFIDDSAEYWAITLSLLIIDLDEHVVEYY